MKSERLMRENGGERDRKRDREIKRDREEHSWRERERDRDRESMCVSGEGQRYLEKKENIFYK